jgi:hypothetical protein
VKVTFGDHAEATAYVISQNIHRRHLLCLCSSAAADRCQRPATARAACSPSPTKLPTPMSSM